MKIVVNRFSYNLYEMTLRVYRAYPFVTQNAVSPVDFFTGNGVSNTFNLIYNPLHHQVRSLWIRARAPALLLKRPLERPHPAQTNHAP